MTQTTPIVIGTNAFGLPVLPNPQELYDQIMGEIEPELTTAVLPTLQEKYAQEAPEKAKERALRYAKAYKQYDLAFANYKSALHRASKKCTTTAAKSFEATYRRGETHDLEDLEKAFDEEPSAKSYDA